MNITIKLLEDAQEFVEGQPQKVREKILKNMKLIEGGVKKKELLEKLGDTDIWELRTHYGNNAYRLLSFWDTDENTLIIATHGFQKKTNKTPKKEIEKAQSIRKEYFCTKENQQQ